MPDILRRLLVTGGCVAALSMASVIPGYGEDQPRPSLGLSVDPGAMDNGLPVLTVVPGSTADRMGVRIGDRLLSLDGRPLTIDLLRVFLRTATVGASVTVRVRRGLEELDLSGTMDVRPTPTAPRASGPLSSRIDELDKKLDAQKPTLGQILALLQDIESDLPRAAEEFKKVYPNGEFDINIKIRIVSDKFAAQPIDLTPAPATSPRTATGPKSATRPILK